MKGAFSDVLKGVVSKHFPGASPRTPTLAPFARPSVPPNFSTVARSPVKRSYEFITKEKAGQMKMATTKKNKKRRHVQGMLDETDPSQILPLMIGFSFRCSGGAKIFTTTTTIYTMFVVAVGFGCSHA